ncbi:PQQ-dependent sugar dehydrogenase [Solirubrobacter phytolaccae]|uniref:PQQ-dependent sugar dehydrogenase n=1 Tax=Solirubrobacter phytolaccae TaxID=1404360 RepID=A0A9X3NAQ7_9ACTN|nr:PQQ-dependent sugar dehydrogenase [Solirubrobacter phytolaccae]MDA0179247.1 PQQ-dependent sugar dehydrogenase [Solirubrobacter phytolaccae]
MVAVLVLLAGAASASAVVLPKGFTETTVWSGLRAPVVTRFADDGRVFVAGKGGSVDVFDSLEDTSPTRFVDLSEQVHDYWDRGLLGMTLDPHFTTGRPYVYVLYAYDKEPGNPLQPRWGDTCPSPPGPTEDGCVISGRLSRLAPDGTETVLIEGWCQQFPSHSVGGLEFGPDGQLYVSAGDGASFNWGDYGQNGNPCGDPVDPLDPTSAKGGSLRSQSFSRPAGEPVVLNGAILRVDPDTGAASAGNPAIADADENRRRIIAYGFRNPFRFTFRPGTRELWIGDVGADFIEEINRLQDVANVPNYGWPCYEGTELHWAFGTMGNQTCDALYAHNGTSDAYFSYRHGVPVVPGDPCPAAQGSISGLAFYTGDAFPAKFKQALFFSDHSRQCVWVAYAGAGGLPDMSTLETFASDVAIPVSLTEGPDGALYYADLLTGAIRRIEWRGNRPTAHVTATPSEGLAPLDVAFDGTGSTAPEGRELSYAWDLDGDGEYDDSTAAKPTFTYTSPGTVVARLRVTEVGGQSHTAAQTITIGALPTVAITAPDRFTVGETLDFSGSAQDSTGASLPASALTWSLAIRHCARTDATLCHTHPVENWVGKAGASVVAPDHEYPSHLQLSLTAVDGAGLLATKVVRIDPRTVDLTLASDPPGLELTLGNELAVAPFTRTVMARSQNSVAAKASQTLGGVPYTFAGWSGGVTPGGSVTAPASGTATYTARFTPPPTPTPTATATPTATPPPEDPPRVIPFLPPDLGGLPAAPKLLGAWGFNTGTKQRVAGRHGKALRLDGRNRFAVSPKPLDAFTVETWVYATRAGTVAQRGSAFRLPTTLRKRWTHLALTYDGTALRTYRDGKLIATKRGALPRSTSPLRFGAFVGRLDDVRLYDGALDAPQLARDMRAAVR